MILFGKVSLFLMQVVDTVIACAHRSVLHGDIKDENVMVDLHTGRLKLIDFGSSRFLKPNSAPLHEFNGTYSLLVDFFEDKRQWAKRNILTGHRV